MTVKATREGLFGHKTASGYVIDDVVPFVALPSVDALGKFVVVRANGRSALAVVLDVGPWNTHDDAYVFSGHRPQAESGVDLTGRATNRAGIDLSEKIWKQLRMKDNDMVEWDWEVL